MVGPGNKALVGPPSGPREPPAPCLADAQIEPAQRTALTEAATAFAEDLLADRASAAYEKMSQPGRTGLSLDELAKAIQFLGSLAPFTGLRGEHTFLVTEPGAAQAAICGSRDRPSGLYLVHITPAVQQGGQQAYVFLAAASRNNGWAITERLQPEGRHWNVTTFSINPSAVLTRGPEDLSALAHAEGRAGHDFNAMILLFAAYNVSQRGPDVRWGIQQELEVESQALKPPQELAGKPPLIWTYGSSRFSVENVSLVGAGGSYVLMLQHRLAQWPGEKAVDQQNHVLIDGFLKSHPEVRSVFDTVVARAINANGSLGFGTVYDFKEGYLKPDAVAPASAATPPAAP